jgi:RNA polymerase sigma factor (sigma-70 family)
MAAATGWLARKRAVAGDVAEEAVQEALLQLVELASGAWPRDLAGWLRRTSERRLIDMERHRRTQLPGSEESGDYDQPLRGPDLDDLMALRSSIATLDPDQRKLVVLRLSGASWRETAEATGLREEAARKRFELGLLVLRELMGDTPRA